MGTLLDPFGSICACSQCQTEPDCNYEQGRREILQYAQHLLRKSENVRVIDKYIEVPDGRLIYSKCFIPLNTKPKGCVFYLVGYANMVDRPSIHEGCLTFAENGYMVIAHDHIGYGRSDGLWIYIPNTFDIDYVDNAHYVHNYCKDLYIRNLTSDTQHNELYGYHDPSIFNSFNTMPWNSDDLSDIDVNNKYFVCGRSMGGAVATRLAMKYRQSYRGLILLCPMIAIDDAIKPARWVQWVGTRVAAWFPKRTWTPSPDMNPWMLSDKGLKYKMDGEPLLWGRPGRLKTVFEMNRITQTIQENMDLLKMDFIVLHGLQDKVTPCKSSQDLYQNRKNECDATIKLYDKSFHLMWWEPCAHQMESDMLMWINEKCQEKHSKKV